MEAIDEEEDDLLDLIDPLNTRVDTEWPEPRSEYIPKWDTYQVKVGPSGNWWGKRSGIIVMRVSTMQHGVVADKLSYVADRASKIFENRCGEGFALDHKTGFTESVGAWFKTMTGGEYGDGNGGDIFTHMLVLASLSGLCGQDLALMTERAAICFSTRKDM